MGTKKYVVDTSLINQLVNGTVPADELPIDGTFVASHVQHDELSKTRNPKRREELLQKFAEIIQQEIPTETFVLDVSEFQKANLGEGRLYAMLKADLDLLNGSKPNNVQDALIAETAKKNCYVLLMADFHMRLLACAHHIAHIYWPSGRYKGPTG